MLLQDHGLRDSVLLHLAFNYDCLCLDCVSVSVTVKHTLYQINKLPMDLR